ncbi:hypothetical protein FD33_GL002209 [Companilactobacillus paralimentarius DSM 13238 = JCM 10415]|uniref:Uncharacterized protein n=1 Tax=Companilactobacillus paralimentarius DSM 13238 = JCM 10415 TaxID=1122151 RepID=A0A0R1PG89_9LACO|nr:hypothetical protein [Companilactobacillus paralimentarius]KAE9564520.1 hypothetical protein ATN96_08145 [Companilactobacillus paralimentarius]KAE9564940.1 hypothetical protein ATN96_06015 [Companilactobacillus paralimentarius]KRL31228.1 hypothetical protein FD33_GL002209 [Companilactobacillus paralimentarius DSM 13238 = JCM 10415]QFR70117.1 hypothetical protein LP238_10460 [Companilactobacillus paralimentarius]
MTPYNSELDDKLDKELLGLYDEMHIYFDAIENDSVVIENSISYDATELAPKLAKDSLRVAEILHIYDTEIAK